MRATLKNFIDELQTKSHTDKQALSTMQKRLEEGAPFVKNEGSHHHFCAFLVPYHHATDSIFIGHHKKAEDWIPPGGHLEPSEHPHATVRREFTEELFFTLGDEYIELFDATTSVINRPQVHCVTHYDVWFIVHMKQKVPFVFDRGEFYDARWMAAEEVDTFMTTHDNFKNIVKKIPRHSRSIQQT